MRDVQMANGYSWINIPVAETYKKLQSSAQSTVYTYVSHTKPSGMRLNFEANISVSYSRVSVYFCVYDYSRTCEELARIRSCTLYYSYLPRQDTAYSTITR